LNDDWRLQIDFEEKHLTGRLIDHLGAVELEHDLSTAYEDRVIVSHEGDRVFLYAGTRDQAEAAQAHIEQLVAQHGWRVKIDLRHWHPIAEDWEDPDLPIPASDAARAVEHEAAMAAERRGQRQNGYPEFEVRMDFPTRHDAAGAAEKLRAEGMQTVHRAKYLLVGAADEDGADALAERLRSELPDGVGVTAEGTLKAAWGERPPDPYAIFGGLGG
jgi:hypothetical protein